MSIYLFVCVLMKLLVDLSIYSRRISGVSAVCLTAGSSEKSTTRFQSLWSSRGIQVQGRQAIHYRSQVGPGDGGVHGAVRTPDFGGNDKDHELPCLSLTPGHHTERHFRSF